MKLPPPWLRVRDAAERQREREWLAKIQAWEKWLVRLGAKIRPRKDK